MIDANNKTATALKKLGYAWLVLVILTLLTLSLGQWFHGTLWLQLFVAAIIWLKGFLVAQQFIEIGQTHPFIRCVVHGFLAVPPIALCFLAFWRP